MTSTRYHKYWRILKLVQIHRVISCITYFESDRYRPRAYLKIMKLAMLILFAIHFLTCVLMNALCTENIGTVSPHSELTGYDGAEKYSCEVFLKSNLMSFQTGTHLLSNTGFSDFEAFSEITMLGTILSILAGFTIFSIFTAIVVAMIMENGRVTLQFRQGADNLIKFLEGKNVKKSLRRRAYQHLTLIWERTKGVNEHYLEELSLGLKLTEDIFLNRYQHILKEACLFSDVSSSTFKIFVREVQVYHFRKGEAIVRARDVISHIFFLVSGQVEVKDEFQDYIRTLETASVFGNLERSRYSGSTVSFTARRNVELCALPTERFLNIAKLHPKLFLRIGGYFDRKKDYLLPLSGEIDLLRGLKKQSSQFYDMESDDEPVSNKKFSSSVTNSSSLRLVLENRWFKFGLKPEHNIFEVVDIATLFTTFVNLLIIPYLFVTQDTSPSYYAHLALEPIFYLRLFMKFHKGFVSYYGNLITSKNKIAKRYLNSPQEVFWDVVPNIPLELLCFTFHPEDWFFFYTCFRLIHILRFYYIRNYFHTHEDTLIMKKWLPLAKIATYSVLCGHFVSCIFLFTACPFSSCSSKSWIQSISLTSEIASDNKMLVSYLYVSTLMISTDIGSIVMKRWFEISFSSLTILLGKVITTLLIGEMLKVLLNYGSPFMHFSSKTRLILNHFKVNDISDYILRKTDMYLQKMWKYEKGENLPELLDILPYSLKCDVMYSLYHEPLRELFLFKDTSVELLRQICSKLQRVVYFQNDYVLKQRDFYAKMYFIYEGEVTVFNKYPDLTEAHHVILRKNDSFGVLQGLNLEMVQHFSYRVTSKKAEILSLAYKDWIYLLEFFPDEKQKIVSRGKGEFARF
nr:unnamed protein product [Callosobruchus analis]